MQNARENRTATLTIDTALETTVRPIGEVMPLVLARYGAGPYRFHWCGDGLAAGNETEHAGEVPCGSMLALTIR